MNGLDYYTLFPQLFCTIERIHSRERGNVANHSVRNWRHGSGRRKPLEESAVSLPVLSFVYVTDMT
jgi:hypothetical protein